MFSSDSDEDDFEFKKRTMNNSKENDFSQVTTRSSSKPWSDLVEYKLKDGSGKKNVSSSPYIDVVFFQYLRRKGRYNYARPVMYSEPLFLQMKEGLCQRFEHGYKLGVQITIEHIYYNNEIIKNALLLHQNEKTSLAMLGLCFNPELCAEMLWKVGNQILLSNKCGHQFLASFYSMMRLLCYDEFLSQVVMDYVYSLLITERTIHEAYQVATSNVSNKRIADDLYYHAFFGNFEYAMWKLEYYSCKNTNQNTEWKRGWGNEDDNESDEDSDPLKSNTQMEFHAQRAIQYFKLVEKEEGICDLILPKYVELITHYKGQDLAIEALMNHMINNPNNPNSYEFYLHYVDQTTESREELINLLEVYCTKNPYSHDWGKELLTLYRKAGRYSDMLALLVTRLDHQSCQDSFFDWHLLYKLFDFSDKIKHEYLEENLSPDSSFIKYHFIDTKQNVNSNVYQVKKKIAEYINIPYPPIKKSDDVKCELNEDNIVFEIPSYHSKYKTYVSDDDFHNLSSVTDILCEDGSSIRIDDLNRCLDSPERGILPEDLLPNFKNISMTDFQGDYDDFSNDFLIDSSITQKFCSMSVNPLKLDENDDYAPFKRKKKGVEKLKDVESLKLQRVDKIRNRFRPKCSTEILKDNLEYYEKMDQNRVLSKDITGQKELNLDIKLSKRKNMYTKFDETLPCERCNEKQRSLCIFIDDREIDCVDLCSRDCFSNSIKQVSYFKSRKKLPFEFIGTSEIKDTMYNQFLNYSANTDKFSLLRNNHNSYVITTGYFKRGTEVECNNNKDVLKNSLFDYYPEPLININSLTKFKKFKYSICRWCKQESTELKNYNAIFYGKNIFCSRLCSDRCFMRAVRKLIYRHNKNFDMDLLESISIRRRIPYIVNPKLLKSDSSSEEEDYDKKKNIELDKENNVTGKRCIKSNVQKLDMKNRNDGDIISELMDGRSRNQKKKMKRKPKSKAFISDLEDDGDDIISELMNSSVMKNKIKKK